MAELGPRLTDLTGGREGKPLVLLEGESYRWDGVVYCVRSFFFCVVIWAKEGFRGGNGGGISIDHSLS